MAIDRRRKDPGEVVVGPVGGRGEEEGGSLVRAHVVSRVHDLPSLLNKRVFVFPCVVRSPGLEVFPLLLFQS